MLELRSRSTFRHSGRGSEKLLEKWSSKHAPLQWPLEKRIDISQIARTNPWIHFGVISLRRPNSAEIGRVQPKYTRVQPHSFLCRPKGCPEPTLGLTEAESRLNRGQSRTEDRRFVSLASLDYRPEAGTIDPGDIQDQTDIGRNSARSASRIFSGSPSGTSSSVSA